MADMIISKSKTKAAVTDCNVSGEFYAALDAKVRDMIKAGAHRIGPQEIEQVIEKLDIPRTDVDELETLVGDIRGLDRRWKDL